MRFCVNAAFFAIALVGADVNASEHFDAGNRHMEQDAWEEAIECYTRAVESGDQRAKVFANRGLARAQLRQLDEAEADLQAAIEIEDDGRYYAQLAIVVAEKGEQQRSLRLFDDAVQRRPDYAQAYAGRGTLYLRMKLYDDAERDLRRALDIDANQSMARESLAGVCYFRGEQLIRSGDPTRAVRRFTEAIRLKPEQIHLAYFGRAKAHFVLDDFEAALKDMTTSLSHGSATAQAFCHRATVYAKMREYDQALVDLHVALSLDAEYADAYSLRGAMHLARRQWDKAVSDYRQAMRLQGGELGKEELANAYCLRGQAAAEDQRFDYAVDDFTKAIELTPNDPTLYQLRAEAYDSVGRPECAARDRQAIDMSRRLR